MWSFGFEFKANDYCREVLTLQFDDIVKEVEGCVLFNHKQAKSIIEFIKCNKEVETLLIHCYAGQARSKAVGAFAVEMLGGNADSYFEDSHPNEHIYDTLGDEYDILNMK